MGNFGINAFIGIPASYSVLPTLIYRRLAGFGPDVISEVAVLSVLIGVIAFTGVLIQGWMLRKRDYRTLGVPSTAPDAYVLGGWRPVAETACWAIIVLILVLPVTALLATSLVSAYGVPLTAASATLDNYVEVMFRQSVTIRAFSNSFMLAGSAALVLTVIAIPLAYFIVWRPSPVVRVLNLIAELPYALPGVVLAIACILLFLKPIPIVQLTIYGTMWIIFVAYLGRFPDAGPSPHDQRIPPARSTVGGSRPDGGRVLPVQASNRPRAARGADCGRGRSSRVHDRLQRADGLRPAVVLGIGDGRSRRVQSR